MDNNMKDTLTPEECTSRIFELSGAKFEPDIAADLWPKILQHKWLLSEKLGRDGLASHPDWNAALTTVGSEGVVSALRLPAPMDDRLPSTRTWGTLLTP